jgi:UDP-glucose 4-epimerase
LGSKEYINLKDLAAMMVQLYPSGHYEVVPFPSELKAIDIGDYYSDYTKANQVLEWAPQIDLKEGLKRSIDYYTENYVHYW